MKVHFSRRDAFTLTEVLVSSALIVAIMAIMFTTIEQTRRTITTTTARVAQFQGARIAFEAMTRSLSQATLNTYYDLDRRNDIGQNPIGYRRNSDLHFVSGRAFQPKLLGGSDAKMDGDTVTADHLPGHAVFFQAPLGTTAEELSTQDLRYRGLTNLISVTGFYVRWDEERTLPQFLSRDETIDKRKRFRLMQVQQPAETMMVYTDSNYTILNEAGLAARPGQGYKNATDWIKVATGLLSLPNDFELPPGATRKANYSRPLAENIVALIILPKVPENDRDKKDRLDDITDDYEYDTCPQIAFDAQKRDFKTSDPMQLKLLNLRGHLSTTEVKQLHQLPPIVQVTMVAIDEASAQKLHDYSDDPTDFTEGLFTKVGTYAQFINDLGDPKNPKENSVIYRVSNPNGTLPTPRMNYRVFTTDVVLRGSKWSK